MTDTKRIGDITNELTEVTGSELIEAESAGVSYWLSLTTLRTWLATLFDAIGTAAAAVAGHVSAADPHAVYALKTGIGSAAAKNTGTSGDAIGLLNTANTYSATQTVRRDDADATMRLVGDGFGASYEAYACNDSADGASKALYKARGSYAAPDVVQDGDDLGTLDFYAYDGFTYLLAGQIKYSVTTVGGVGDVSSRLDIAVRAPGGGMTTGLSLMDNGTVSIGEGTSTSIIVGGNQQSGLLYLSSSAGATDTMMMEKQVDIGQPLASFNRARAAGAAVQNGDTIGLFVFRAHDGADYNNGATFGAVVDGSVADNATPTAFVFKNTATTGLSERMRISSAGYMGVGTASPSTTLHVNGPIRCASYTVGTAPSASATGAGTYIYISDESGGAVMAFSDGTNWRRVTDRAIIS